MSEAIRTYLLSVIAASVLTVLVRSVVPDGAVKRAASVICGVLVMLCALSPLLSIDSEQIAQSIWRTQMQTEALQTGVEVKNRALVSDIIKEKTQTYIWDKAASIGLDVTVEVEMRDDGEYPYAYAVTLTGIAGEAQRRTLTQTISENLAIPAERQTWKEP